VRQGAKDGLAVGASDEDSIQSDDVEVGSQAQISGTPLDDGEQAALGGQGGRRQAACVPAEQGVGEDAGDSAHEAGLVGQRGAQLKGEGQDPLAQRLRGQDEAQEVCGGLVHPAAGAGGAESAPAAGKGHHARSPAPFARKVGEAPAEHAAVEIAGKLASSRAAARALLGRRAAIPPPQDLSRSRPTKTLGH
jgi:hypothetical protein